jgi:hypothetical protein
VANDVTAAGAGFDHETNIVTLYPRDGRELPLPRMSKLEVAYRILDAALEIRHARRNETGAPSVASPETPVAKSVSLPKVR